jgi:cupin fold WbuC family metalloprotein
MCRLVSANRSRDKTVGDPYSCRTMITAIDDELFTDLLHKAAEAPRRRAHHIFHLSHDEPVQRLCIALKHGTYVRPHCHRISGKWELLLVLRGTVDLLLFDNAGNVTERRSMSAGGGLSAVELTSDTWHSVITTGEDAVIMEVKQGPFAPTAPEEFAAWAPPEGNDAVEAYLEWSATAQPGDCYQTD